MSYAWGQIDIKSGQHCPACGKNKRGKFYVKVSQPGYNLGATICSSCASGLGRAIERHEGNSKDKKTSEDDSQMSLPFGEPKEDVVVTEGREGR